MRLFIAVLAASLSVSCAAPCADATCHVSRAGALVAELNRSAPLPGGEAKAVEAAEHYEAACTAGDGDSCNWASHFWARRAEELRLHGRGYRVRSAYGPELIVKSKELTLEVVEKRQKAAWTKHATLSFASASKEDSIEAFRDFLAHFAKSAEAPQARHRLGELEYAAAEREYARLTEHAGKAGSAESLIVFASEHKELRERWRPPYELLLRQFDAAQARAFLDLFGPERLAGTPLDRAWLEIESAYVRAAIAAEVQAASQDDEARKETFGRLLSLAVTTEQPTARRSIREAAQRVATEAKDYETATLLGKKLCELGDAVDECSHLQRVLYERASTESPRSRAFGQHLFAFPKGDLADEAQRAWCTSRVAEASEEDDAESLLQLRGKCQADDGKIRGALVAMLKAHTGDWGTGSYRAFLDAYESAREARRVKRLLNKVEARIAREYAEAEREAEREARRAARQRDTDATGRSSGPVCPPGAAEGCSCCRQCGGVLSGEECRLVPERCFFVCMNNGGTLPPGFE